MAEATQKKHPLISLSYTQESNKPMPHFGCAIIVQFSLPVEPNTYFPTLHKNAPGMGQTDACTGTEIPNLLVAIIQNLAHPAAIAQTLRQFIGYIAYFNFPQITQKLFSQQPLSAIYRTSPTTIRNASTTLLLQNIRYFSGYLHAMSG